MRGKGWRHSAKDANRCGRGSSALRRVQYRRSGLVDEARWRILGMALAVLGVASLPRARSEKARVTREKRMALAARLRLPMRLQMQLEDDARLTMLTPEAADLVGIVAIERLRDGKTTLRGSN